MTALAFRDATDDDRAFVTQSWLRSYRDAHAAGLIAMDDWRDVMGPQIERMLARPGVRIVVAHCPGEEGTGADVYGWIAVEPGGNFVVGKSQRVAWRPPMVLYCYVKHVYRRLGIARRLLREAGLSPTGVWDYAAKTEVVGRLRDKIPRARWTPLRARKRPKPVGEDHVQDREGPAA